MNVARCELWYRSVEIVDNECIYEYRAFFLSCGLGMAYADIPLMRASHLWTVLFSG